MNKDLYYYSQQFSLYSSQLSMEINSIELMYQDKARDLITEVYLSLLKRIGINIKSINQLSKIFLKENVSSSIALLFRSCISDIFLGHYLLLFKADFNSFNGVIKIKDAEFLKYAIKVGPIEQSLLSKSNEDLVKREGEFLNIIKDKFHDLIENADSVSTKTLKLKSAKSIRQESESNPEFLSDLFNKALTEDEMFNRLLVLDSMREQHYKSVYILCRFYAQFQHYTFASRDFIRCEKEDFLYYFLQSLMHCYSFTSVLQKEVLQISLKDFKMHYQEIYNLVKEYNHN